MPRSKKDAVARPILPSLLGTWNSYLNSSHSNKLAAADAEEGALSFVVIIPAVHEKDLKAETVRVVSAVKRFAARAHRQMVQSSACTLHIVLPAKEHGYIRIRVGRVLSLDERTKRFLRGNQSVREKLNSNPII